MPTAPRLGVLYRDRDESLPHYLCDDDCSTHFNAGLDCDRRSSLSPRPPDDCDPPLARELAPPPTLIDDGSAIEGRLCRTAAQPPSIPCVW